MNDTNTAAAPATTSASAPAATPATTVNDASASLAAADSSLAASETPAESTPAAAGAQPAESLTPVSAETLDDPRSPFIPRARFDEVNTQKKAAEEALKHFEPIKGVPVERLQVAVNLADSFDANPVATLLELQRRIESHTEYGPQLRSQAARTLASGRQPQAVAPAADLMPEADFQLPDGTLFYSAQQEAKKAEWVERQLLAKMDERLKPFQQDREAAQQREATAKAYTDVSTVLNEFRADPDFKANEAGVKAEIAKDTRLADLANRDPKAALELAYARVWRATVYPKQQRASEGQTLTNLQQRAVAAAGTNPAAAAPVTPKSTINDARAALMAAGGGN